MTRTVAGLYEDFAKARLAMSSLVEKGFERGKISLMAKDINGIYDHYLQEARSPDGPGVNGYGLGKYTVPGIGSMVGTGPVIMAGEGNGDGILQALIQAGIPQVDAEIYAEGIRRGGTLVLVFTEDDQTEEVIGILNQFHPISQQQIASFWQKQNWQGFDGNGEPFAFEPNRDMPLRAAESELDYGAGARSFLAGKPISDYDRSEADMANYVNRNDDEWIMAKSGFVDDLKENYTEAGHEKDKFETAKQFGYNSSYDPRFKGMDWDHAVEALKGIWAMDYPAWAWEKFEEVIHKGWSEGHPQGLGR